MIRFLKYRAASCLLFTLLLVCSCKKQDNWLDVKSSLGYVTPQTLADYQAILDYNTLINKHFANIGLIGSDNIVVSNTVLPSLQQVERDAYLWKPTLWDGLNGSSLEWTYFYNIVEYANIVLDGLLKIDPKSNNYNNVKGQALFFRAIACYNLQQLFCKTYDATSASNTLGIPVRLSSDVNILYQRASLQQTFDQIVEDLKQASVLMDAEPLNNQRPARYAALALLSKIFLVMGDYTNAGIYANQVLIAHPALLDFNSPTVSQSSTYRFPVNGMNNPEVLFYAQCQSYNTVRPFTTTTSTMAPALINMYDVNDLRKVLFYVQSGTSYTFRGSYTGTFATFCGIGTNELYLIRAECFARQNNIAGAMADINTLLKNRYKTGSFLNLNASDAVSALDIVLNERRKELPLTANQRWEDLKRLNKEVKYQVTITRTYNSDTYTLLPNSNAYTLQIPSAETQLSGITQNEK